MTHYRMLDRAPSVVITSNRNELKLYQGNVVYLNDGDNFELRFFNPLQQKIGVEIIFNGIRKGDGFLVLNPGQDLILDRFLDEQRKMLFETYVIDGNNEEAVKAIQKNGVIDFNFYKENLYGNYWNNNYDDMNIKYKFPPKPYYENKRYSKGLSRGVQGVASAGVYCTTTPTCGGPSTTSTLSNSKSFSSIPYANNSSYNTLYNLNGMGSLSFGECEVDPLETGRIEKGEFSEQNLRNVNMQFESLAFHSISYKILPCSTANRTIDEIREYCPSCGYRIRKSNWVYCPKCGNLLN